jgi:hypothetical protein
LISATQEARVFFVETLQRRKRENRQGKLLPIGHRAGAKARVLKDPRGETPEPGFPTVDGPHYYDVLAALHDFVTPEWYFEIGTNRGGSLEVCPGKFIAVDPQLILTNFSMKDRPEGHFFQITSDGFFDLGFLEGLGIRPELGFLDGMHRFEFLLRDFMNFEKRSAPGAIAILHDCLPFTAAMTARDWDPKKTRQWTGDVWKTLAILLKHRPDLQIDVLDAYPTGLVIRISPRSVLPPTSTCSKFKAATPRSRRCGPRAVLPPLLPRRSPDHGTIHASQELSHPDRQDLAQARWRNQRAQVQDLSLEPR